MLIFALNYTISVSVPVADQVSLSDNLGWLTSHGYPGSYPADAYNLWNITSPVGGVILLYNITLDMECPHDYIQIHDNSHPSEE